MYIIDHDGEVFMKLKKRRVPAALHQEDYEFICMLAQRMRCSLSAVVTELVYEALNARDEAEGAEQ